MSSPTQAVSKKRKKPDAKPQSQINKCLNEKRRREQENTYIEELAELIQASIASDMSSLSVKPDKCAILQQTVNQIRRIKAAEGAGEGAVQQGEVSSSKPTLLPTQRIGTLVLEALGGFLFIVSHDGKIEFVSDKVSHFIKFTSEDLTGTSIYNIIHVGDHAKFSSSFMSVGWPSEASEASRSRNFNCRLLVKPPDDQEETMEEKQQRVSQYENMQITAVLLPSSIVENKTCESFEGEGQQCLVCVVRRIPSNERIQGTPVEQFTTKLDTQGTIIGLDSSGVSPRYSQFLNKERIGEPYTKLIPPADISRVQGHLRETVQSGQASSQVYCVKIGTERSIRVQTKSKFFRDLEGSQPEGSFIMATHTIIGPFQEGSGSSASDRLLPGSSSNSGSMLDETLGGRPGSTEGAGDDAGVSSLSDNGRLRRLLSHSDSVGDLSEGPNKILKDLLNQKDEDDTQGGGVGGGGGSGSLGRFIPHFSHLEKTPNASSSPSANSTHDNTMLKVLLNTDDDDNENRLSSKDTDEIWNLLNTDENTSEFRQPQGLGGGTQSTNSTSSLSSSHNTLSNNPQPTSNTVPPRPSSADLTSPNMLRGMKRPCDEAHDGNPSKQQQVGGFESLLDPSPPASMSTIGQHGRPPTPHGGPLTPHGGPPTPHGRPGTPHGGPPTPHSGVGGPPTPIGNNSSSGMSHNGPGAPNNQGPSKLRERNRMLALLLAKESPINQSQNTPPTADPTGLPQEKLPKDLKEKMKVPGPWQGPGRHESQMLVELLEKGHINNPPRPTLKASGPPLGMPVNPTVRTPGTPPIMVSPGGIGPPGLTQTSQPNMSTQGGMGMNNNNNMCPGVSNRVSMSGSFVSTTSTNSLPSITDSFNISNQVSSCYPEGSLPPMPIITSSAASFGSQNDSESQLRESVINDILEMDNDEVRINSSPLNMDDLHQIPNSSADAEIQKIEKSLMYAAETQSSLVISEAGSLPPYTAVVSASSMSNYPPPYNHKRIPNAGPPGGPGGGTGMVGSHMNAGGMMRPTIQFSPNPGSPTIPSRPSLPPQRMNANLTQRSQEYLRQRLLQQQQQQVIVPSNTSDVTQPPASSYQAMNMDDLLNNSIAPNVNVTLQRNVADSQTSPSYNLLNSPLSGGQISPGQRIPQPPYSPHGQTTSPIPNQQYTNSGQMSGYQTPQGSQLSPRLSQGSPVPSSYQPGGQPLPQMSPTGAPGTPVVQVPSGQQSPAWSAHSPQPRPSLMIQNPILNAQLGGSYMRPDNRPYPSGVRGGQLPSMRSMPSPGTRQSPYPSMGPPTPGSTAQGDAGPYPPSSPQGQPSSMYQQQQPQQPTQFRLQRAGPMAGVHSPRSAHHFPPAPGQHHDPSAPPPHLSPAAGGHLPSPHSVPPSALAHHPHMGHHHPGSMPPSLMASVGSSPMGCPSVVSSAGGPGDVGPHMVGGAAMGGGGGGAGGSGMPGMVGGVMSQSYGGEHAPPHPHSYEAAAQYYGPPDPANRNSTDNNNWAGESVNTTQAGALSGSPRMDDNRGNTGSEKGKTESMLKHLLSK
uniref:Taiman-b n=2 Tax=Macrobrachium nipponense TaxID=159736 RepID=A0A7D5XRI3_MACNP|nr:taiman-b [Macrobrachium nipponense]